LVLLAGEQEKESGELKKKTKISPGKGASSRLLLAQC